MKWISRRFFIEKHLICLVKFPYPWKIRFNCVVLVINTTFPVIKAIKSKGCCIFFLAATSNSLCLGFLKHDLTLKTETTSSRVSILVRFSPCYDGYRETFDSSLLWCERLITYYTKKIWSKWIIFFLILLFLLLIGRAITSEIKKVPLDIKPWRK